MKKHSCGAILYTIHNNSLYIVLGMEKAQWFPFKGVREKDETNQQAAIREICEETCGVVKAQDISDIDLQCNYTTKRKHYHIGLAYIPYGGIREFYKNRNKLIAESESLTEYKGGDAEKWAYLEKTQLSTFSLNAATTYKFHYITDTPIKFYHARLMEMQSTIRSLGISLQYRDDYPRNSSKYNRINCGQKENISRECNQQEYKQKDENLIQPNNRPILYLLN